MSDPQPIPTPPPPQLDYRAPAQWDAKPLSWPAVLSVPVAVLLPVVPLISGVIAWFLSRAGLRQTASDTRRGRGWAVWGRRLAIANLVLSPFVIGLQIYGMHQARERARDVQSMSNLRQLGLATMMYANANRGFLPASFDHLVPTYIPPGSGVFRSPRGTPGKPAMTFASGTSDYIYGVPGPRITRLGNPAFVPMMYEPPAHYGGLRAPILFADGHVEIVTPPRLAPLLAQVDANRPAAATQPAIPVPPAP